MVLIISMKFDLSQENNKNGILSYKINDDKDWKIALNDININKKYVLSVASYTTISYNIIQ